MIRTHAALFAASLLASPALAGSGVTTFTDRAAFEAAITVDITEDFNDAYEPGAIASANLGQNSGPGWDPFVFAALNGGGALIASDFFNTGDTAAPYISGDGAIAEITFGGQRRAFGLDLITRCACSFDAATYELTLFDDGVMLAGPFTFPAESFAGFLSDVPFDAVRIAGLRADGVTDANEHFDNLVADAYSYGFTAEAPEGLAYLDNRAEFEAAIAVSRTLDFEAFFPPGSTGAANFGPNSGNLFLPLLIRATNSGEVRLFTEHFHAGDSTAAAIFGEGSSAEIDLGGSFKEIGLELGRYKGLEGAEFYDIELLAGGVPVAAPITVLFGTYAGLTSDAAFDTVRITGTQIGYENISEVFDSITLGQEAEALCAGDCDGSGSVDFNDLVSILFEFGAPDPSATCDADASGGVDFNDLVAALFLFGPCA